MIFKKKVKQVESNMNRTQKRLFEKQLRIFYDKFNNFNIVQLGLIRDLIDNLLNKKGGVH